MTTHLLSHLATKPFLVQAHYSDHYSVQRSENRSSYESAVRCTHIEGRTCAAHAAYTYSSLFLLIERYLGPI